MGKFLIVVSFLFLLILSSAENALACFCRPDWTKQSLQQKVVDEYKKATTVFSGKVVEMTHHPKYKYGVLIKFEINDIWKNNSTETIFIGTNDDTAACGYDFKIGKRYLVYAFGEVDDLVTNSCTRTSVFENNKDIKILNKLRKEKP